MTASTFLALELLGESTFGHCELRLSLIAWASAPIIYSLIPAATCPASPTHFVPIPLLYPQYTIGLLALKCVCVCDSRRVYYSLFSKIQISHTYAYLQNFCEPLVHAKTILGGGRGRSVYYSVSRLSFYVLLYLLTRKRARIYILLHLRCIICILCHCTQFSPKTFLVPLRHKHTHTNAAIPPRRASTQFGPKSHPPLHWWENLFPLAPQTRRD